MSALIQTHPPNFFYMIRRKLWFVFALLTGALNAGAVSSDSNQNRQSFEEFRKGILSDYQDFRQTLLDRYADFLNGEWHEYESYNGVKRYSKPKPRNVPKADNSTDDKVKQPSRPKRTTEPEIQPEIQETPLPEKPIDDKIKDKKGNRRNDKFDEISFYGLPYQIPKIEFKISDKLYANNDYAAQWRELQKADVAANVLPEIKKLSNEIGLNDYLTYQLIQFYIDAKFPDADDTSKMSAIHYLLANLGYDARIAVTGRGVPLLLIPFKQTIYSRTYMMIGNKKYYVFEPEGFSLAKAGPQQILTCRLPEDINNGKSMDLRVGKLNVPFKPKSFELAYGPVSLHGEVNENLMPILYHYPQMPVSDFANSDIQPELRKQLVKQMRSQLSSLEGDEAVSVLLQFMHNVFEYATDEDFHGFEKPYFLEETLYYPKNDCEDRAIFYTYFLWNALDREAQLISFPGHEAATVRLDAPVEGTCYDYDGTTFYISDPTFIGSKTGMIMPVYRNTPPNIDFTFQNK